jgi:CMP-2-keto-3-deoxyoctulosonic acid synthetase
VLLLLGALIAAELVTMAAAVDAEEECNNPNTVRLVTQEELAMYVPHHNSSSIIVCTH